MPKGTPVDIESLHVILWDSTDRLGRLDLKQTEFAKRFGCTKYTMSRAITKMIEDKRLRRLSHNQNNRGIFLVEDPQTWAELYGD